MVATDFVPPGTARNLTDSERLVMDIVRRSDLVTRAALPELTGLAQQSISRIVDGLMDIGLLKILRKVPTGGRGKPTVALGVMDEAAQSIGLALQADALQAVVMDLSGTVLRSSTAPVPEGGPKEVIRWLGGFIESQRREGVLMERRLCGVGVGLPRDPSSRGPALGIDLGTPEQWARFQEDASAALGLRVYAERDGNAAAIGESMHGVGRTVTSFAYLNFSCEFGGGLIIDGQAVRGTHGVAADFAGIMGVPSWDVPSLSSLTKQLEKNGRAISILELRDSCELGWPGVSEWIEQAAPRLEVLCRTIVSMVDPEAIVFGGEVPPVLADALIRRIAPEGKLGASRLERSRVQATALAAGAASLPLKSIFY